MSVGPTNPKPDEEFQLPSMINAIFDGEVTRGTGMGGVRVVGSPPAIALYEYVVELRPSAV